MIWRILVRRDDRPSVRILGDWNGLFFFCWFPLLLALATVFIVSGVHRRR